jgi:polyhydroxybutyrate depolymerase
MLDGMTRKGCGPVVLLMLCRPGCGSAPDDGPPAMPTRNPGSTVTIDLDDRPFRLHLPRSYDAATKMPLIVLLHGYTSDAAEAESYFKLTAESDRRGFLYAMPDGTQDARGEQFWNATDACCDFYRSGVDDSGYLRRLFEAVTSSYPVDPGRIYVIGHSNGGFMAYRLACEHPSVIAAIVSFAGAAPHDPAQCTPDRPVNVLHIHGTADSTIRWDGGANAGRPYPSVAATLDLWRRLNGCAERAGTAAAPMDLDSALPGVETTVTTYQTNCRENTRVELWSIAGGEHVPAFTTGFAPAVIDFLLAQVGTALSAQPGRMMSDSGPRRALSRIRWLAAAAAAARMTATLPPIVAAPNTLTTTPWRSPVRTIYRRSSPAPSPAEVRERGSARVADARLR